ncbi:MAG: DUF1499 domain-containing protein [Pacificimonas sp.]|jgi:uncharacterized protein (DUF1499 family)|nr:DUF1499 domain-containing protein [Pacificimonas sp.]
MINDATTSIVDPPRFVLQQDGPPHFDADTAGEHAQRHGDLDTLTLAIGRDEAYDLALTLAQESGWRVIARDPAAGQFEAVATTRLLRFRDDVVVRVRGDEASAQVDMRSRSRVGRSDFGANAKRIDRFLTSLAAKTAQA